MPIPFGPMIATRSPASTVKLKFLNRVLPSKPLDICSMVTAWRCSFLVCSKRMNGLTRLDGLTSASWILSICLAREVACLAFEALAEKRLTNVCSSAIWAFFLALSDSSCSRDWVAAVMYSS
ncbi:hypothetical protein D3C75_1165180 [compost metagenome]